MTALVIAMLLCVTAAAGVLALVALPRLRGGDRLLTPDGREAVDEAARRARALAAGRGPRGAVDARGPKDAVEARGSQEAVDARGPEADVVDLRHDQNAPRQA